MKIDPSELGLFVEVARAGGFRQAARINGKSASWLSETIRRLEEQLGLRLLNRTTRSVVPTEAGARLLERIGPAFAEIGAAVDVVTGALERPAGTLRLNVPTVAARLVLPPIIPGFLAAYPDVRVEVTVDERLVDVIAAGCDAGIRYEERLEADMIAIPIGARVQRFATAAAPTYLRRHEAPAHPRDLLSHACLRDRFPSGVRPPWEFERDGEVVRIDVGGPLLVSAGGATDLMVEAALAGVGVIHLFEDWLRPHLESGALTPVLQPWWQSFAGPFLYFPGRRLTPAPLRAFVDYIKGAGSTGIAVRPV
jgi:DNA-binding transcriptional LysR family regulator